VNLLLIEASELTAGVARLTARRHEHAREVLKVQAGDTLRVGLRGGLLGTAEILSETEAGLELRCVFDLPPPPRAKIDLVLAIPRPKALKRVIPAIASLGVDRVFLVNAARVEKSYFSSKVLAKEFLDGLVDLGLEQARDTIAPTLELRERFKPFVEDELPAICAGSVCLVPHPTAEAPLAPVSAAQRVMLAIGPDGGWVPFEVELLQRNGFTPVSLGQRILRVEVAVPAVIGAVRAGR
jgi:RsmE family RNA methyltransferase